MNDFEQKTFDPPASLRYAKTTAILLMLNL